MVSRAIPRTYRIRKDLLEAVEKMADDYGVSESQLVNEWITKCLFLDPLWKHVDAVTVSRYSLAAIMELADEDKLEETGSGMGRVIPKRLFTLYNVEPNWTSVIHALESVYSSTCNWFEFKHHIRGDRHHLIFVHEFGAKWSSFLKGYVKGMLKSLLDVDPKIEVTDKMIELIA